MADAPGVAQGRAALALRRLLGVSGRSPEFNQKDQSAKGAAGHQVRLIRCGRNTRVVATAGILS